jgi:DNA-binding NtrC family response regulator
MGNSPKRILLVEDHPDTLKVTALFLRRNGYIVHTAETVAQALALCDKERFDLLMGDIGLPDGSGLGLMRVLAKRCGIRGIAYSGYGYEKDIAAAIAAGYSAHLLKPADLDKMLKTVARVLKETEIQQPDVG